LGRGVGNAQASVTATIIDHQQIDRQLRGISDRPIPRSASKLAGGQRQRAVDPVEEGKALVRFARRQYLAGDPDASLATYQMAIEILDGRLRQLAIIECRRVHGPAADRVLKTASAPRR
jgi:hypothetical protein